jgi:hypothetical protein
MKRPRITKIAAALAALAAPITGAGQERSPGLTADQAAAVDGLGREAPIVFVGRIKRVGASNLKLLPPGPATALVHVDQVVQAPPALAGMNGQAVTVQLARPESAKAGAQALFFAAGLMYGEHLAVREVAQLPMPVDTAAVRQRLQAAHAADAEEALGRRVEGAILIVSGKVLKIGKVKRPKAEGEHAPDLAPASIRVDAVLKGKAAVKGTVTALFSTSGDERWLQAPKLKVGEEGVFLMHDERELGLPPGSYLLDPLDVQPAERVPAIRRRLEQGGPR